MKAQRQGTGLLWVSLGMAGLLFALSGCDVGPFPDFLEQLDVVSAVEGEATGWIRADDKETHVLVLSEEGKFMHSIVRRDTSVDVEFGNFAIDGDTVAVERTSRAEFPKESGSVVNRDGAGPAEPRDDEVMPFALVNGVLTWGEFGDFTPTSELVSDWDLNQALDRGCLLKFVQLSLRTAQARIQKLGGGGTVIYRDNESSFVGFIDGEQSIVVENLTSPDTTMTYASFVDFPEVEIEGAFVSHVNLSGDGSLDDSLSFRIFGGTEPGEDGAGGAGAGRKVLAEAELFYGRAEPIQIRQADVAGGSYDFELREPYTHEDNFGWEFLEDLDLRSCLE